LNDELTERLTRAPDATDALGLAAGDRGRGIPHADFVDLAGDPRGLALLLMGGKCAAAGGVSRVGGEGANSALVASARNGGETCIFAFDDDARGIGRPPLRVPVPEARGGEDGAEDGGEDELDLVGEARRWDCVGAVISSSKSPSKTPSSIACAAALCWRSTASSRLSMRIYSTASASSSPNVSRRARCSRSRPYALCTCALSSSSR
jgi:hypothetical protein